MARQLMIGLAAEGSTDFRLLKPIVERTFNYLKFECSGEIDILEVEIISTSPGLGFSEKLSEASAKAWDSGLSVLCFHADADNKSAEYVITEKFNPALTLLAQEEQKKYCREIVTLIPVTESESWMLADKSLLRAQIGTDLNDNELNINRFPEDIARPKELIQEAIRIARQQMPQRRRRELKIDELYFPVGQLVDLVMLEQLPSYRQFQKNVRQVFRNLNLLH